MQLKGYSGCILNICESKYGKCVKKLSPAISYNERLESQKRKQEAIFIKGFEKCAVYSDAYDQERYYFLMEYINGSTLSRAIRDMKLNKIQRLAEILCENIGGHMTFDENAGCIFKNKIAELKGRVPFQYELIREAFSYLDQFQWENVVCSKCHGDMTLQNILIKGESLYLIDYLDSFYDSWQIDIAKIFQDTDTMWSYRKEAPDNNLIIRLTLLRDLIHEKILKMDYGKELLETIYYILLLHLLRIYPYVTDDETRRFLDEKVIFIMKKIRDNDWRMLL